MKPKLHHIALNVCDMEWYAALFQEIFHLEIRKREGTAPYRKIWFFEGLQLNECVDIPAQGDICDHISFSTSNIEETVEAALTAGCMPVPNKKNWFALPNGLKVELMKIR